MTAKPYEAVRQGDGRRRTDEECKEHDTRLEEIERNHSWQRGVLYAAIAFLSIVVPIVGWTGNAIYTKLTSIEQILSNGQIMSGKLEEKIFSLDKRISVIESEHSWEHQQEVRK
jgi:hypothetical protein